MSWDLEAQRAAERRVDECMEAMYEFEEDGDDSTESPACAPFCGCTTCIVREALDAAYPIMRRGIAEDLAMERQT